MIQFLRDFASIVKVDLPASISKKRLLLNFFQLWLLSLFSSSRTDIGKINDVKIESGIWNGFNLIITSYVRNLSSEYLMQAYLIQKVATGWHDEKCIQKLRDDFSEEKVAAILPEALGAVERISQVFSQYYKGISFSDVYQWLRTYQYGFTEFLKNTEEIKDLVENTTIVELGAGVGANAAVHATMSKQGVCIFDIPPMLKIQQNTVAAVAASVPLVDINYFSDPQDLIATLEGKRYIVVSYWAFTEFPVSLRDTLRPLIAGSSFTLFASNQHFEGTENKAFLEAYVAGIPGLSMQTKEIVWSPYRHHFYAAITKDV